MIYRRSGRSGLKLSAISLGLWHNFGAADPYNAGRTIIRHAFDRGITHFDLANNYGPPPGSAESNFGKILNSFEIYIFWWSSSIFVQIFNFVPNFQLATLGQILPKFSNFGQIFKFWPNFQFLVKFSIFDQIFIFWPNFQYLTKFLIFDQIFNFWQIFNFSQVSHVYPTLIFFINIYFMYGCFILTLTIFSNLHNI